MNTIEVSSTTASRLTLLASAWETTIDGAVARLIDRLTTEPARAASPDADGGVPVHAVYEGQRAEGLYSPATKELKITAGPGAGHTYRRPSGAAIAVVQEVNPKVNPNRNGWNFWVLTATGASLQTIRNEGR